MMVRDRLRAVGIELARNPVNPHPDSWIEAPAVVHAEVAPMNRVRVGAFSGVYGGRLGVCTIGRFCSIAPNVDIASDQHPTTWMSSSMAFYVDGLHGWRRWLKESGFNVTPAGCRFDSNAQVVVGNDVWIGRSAIIKSGVTIGDGAVVGAGAVVVKDVPPYAIVAGVPAKIIRFRFDEDLINRFLEVKWWNYNVMALSGVDFSSPRDALVEVSRSIAAGEAKPLDLQRYGLLEV